MFANLTNQLAKSFQSLRGKGLLRDHDIATTLAEIRIALLEADVALDLVKHLQAEVQQRASSQRVLQSITPGQQVIKIVHDCLLEVLGPDNRPLHLSGHPAVIMLIGLQGSGKTTSCVKLANHLTRRRQRRPLVASLDIYRPAAQEQLRLLAQQHDITCLAEVAGQAPLSIAQRAISYAGDKQFDTVILDTAGRSQLDDQLMAELQQISAGVKPKDILLVADSMLGQDAINVARGFADQIDLNGLILTRLDGDQRGGAVLSARYVTNQHIKFIGIGEKIDDFEPFYAQRLLSRLFGRGDIASLVEKTQDNLLDEQELASKNLAKGKFDLNDMHQQLRQLTKLGGAAGLLKYLPGVGNKLAKTQLAGKLDDRVIKQQIAIIQSMTPHERRAPKILHANRKKRIAAGSGTSPNAINKLLKQWATMQKMMKSMQKAGLNQAALGAETAASEASTNPLPASSDDLNAVGDAVSGLEKALQQLGNQQNGSANLAELNKNFRFGKRN